MKVTLAVVAASLFGTLAFSAQVDRDTPPPPPSRLAEAVPAAEPARVQGTARAP